MRKRLLRSFDAFVQTDVAGGVLLLFATVAALVWANSRWAPGYFDLWQIPLTIGAGPWVLSKPLLLWINDGLMAVFFFVVGLEIKREILAGELSSPRQAALPLFAALGGMVVPALLYLAFNVGTPGVSGWGIPMATDIAFALGILRLLGKRVPLSLKIFLTALAIVDDLGAVLVIAFFYTSTISWINLGIGALFLFLLMGANRAGIRHPLVYAVLGIGGLWLAFLLSGVHATVAGVLAAFAIPARNRIHAGEFLGKGKDLLREFEEAAPASRGSFATREQQSALYGLERSCEEVQPPLQRLEHAFHPWVSFLIMPLFALANAGVSLREELLAALGHPVALGIAAGLMLGKPAGIFLFSWLSVKMRIAVLPANVRWHELFGIGCLGGIGFTMSLFIASLAFGESEVLSLSKIGILLSSTLMGIVGWGLLRRFFTAARQG